jgi:hypothetical protein
MPSGISHAVDMVALNAPKEVIVNAGDSLEINIGVEIAEGFHIQANPVTDDFLIPTTIKTILLETEGVFLGSPVYPAGKALVLQGTLDTLLVYDQMLSIRLPIMIISSAKPEEVDLKCELRYQACDSASCFAPRSLTFDIPIKVTKR